MATTALGTVLHHLRRSLLRQEEAGRTDGELLERFISRRDEAAFDALLRRHGPMVFGVCRRLLRNEADAEDAFQATFLVLVRKAASIRPQMMVGNWLYGVAHSTALKARAMRIKRLTKEREAAARPKPEGSAQTWDRLSALLDQGLRALPDKYRAAIVLCDLEGTSIKEAAQQLGCPQGTVGTRLARGRRLLSQWLGRRGFALSGEVMASAIAHDSATAGVPPLLVRTTIQAASRVAAGRAASGVVSPKVAALTEGVLKTMTWFTKVKIATALLVGALAFALGGFGMRRFHEPPLAAASGRLQPDAPQTLSGKPKTDQELIQGKQAAPKNLQPPVGDAKPVVVREDAQVRGLAWSANGKILATVGIVYEVVDFTDGDGKPTGHGACWPNSTIKLWDAKTGELKQALGEEKHTYIATIAFSADGKSVAVSTSKHHQDPLKFVTEVRILDAQTWALKHKVDVSGFATALAFSPDGTRLALGGRSRLTETGSFVKLWDVRQEKMIGGTEERPEPLLPVGTGGRVTCLAFSRDGKLLAAGEENGKLRTIEGETGKAIAEWDGHRASVSGVGFAADSKTLVSGSGDKTVKVWDATEGKLLRTLAESKGPVAALAFSPDGQLFATAGSAAVEGKSVEVLLWDAKTWEPKKAVADQTMQVNALAFSPDGTTLAICAGNGFRLGPNTETGRLQTPGEFTLWKLK
jgi:RNA polymerase sigma factor (sigma-70 family)